MRSSLKDKGTWLHDLMHNNTAHADIVKGFLKFYALEGLSIGNVMDDIHFHMLAGDVYVADSMDRLLAELEAEVGK